MTIKQQRHNSKSRDIYKNLSQESLLCRLTLACHIVSKQAKRKMHILKKLQLPKSSS